MLEIKPNGVIYLTRGDSAFLTVKITEDGLPYEPIEGDVLHFSVKKDVDDVDYTIHKVFMVDEAVVINPEDTKELNFGKYHYDVQLSRLNGEVYTVAGPALFYLAEEITNE